MKWTLVLIVFCLGCSDSASSKNDQHNNTNNTNNVVDLGTDSGGELDCQVAEMTFREQRSASCQADSDCEATSYPDECCGGVGTRGTGAQDTYSQAAMAGCEFAQEGGACSNNVVCPNFPTALKCVENACAAVQELSCDDAEDLVNGGLAEFTDRRWIFESFITECSENTDCTIRTDYNPCGCAETFSAELMSPGPLEALQQMSDGVLERCALTCECPFPDDAVPRCDAGRCTLAPEEL